MLAIWILPAKRRRNRNLRLKSFYFAQFVCCTMAVHGYEVRCAVNFNLASDLLKKVNLRLLSGMTSCAMESFDPDHANLLLVSCMFGLDLNFKTQQRTRNEHV